MSFPRYAEYKDSEVEWLGGVPAHWSVTRLKHSLRLRTEKAVEQTNPVALENIEGWSGRFLPSNTEFAGDGVLFERGDILFGKLRPYLAKVYLADRSGEAVGDFHVLRPSSRMSARFAQYQMLSRYFISVVDGSTFGSKMPRASWEFLGNMPFMVPDEPEQSAIAAFLDRETGKIDALIAEQEKLLTLLAEKRQATISHAVTRGFNPNAPMKDSGVPWLGEIPAHWEVRSLKSILSTPITDGPHETPTFLDEGVPFVSAEAVSGSVINFDKIRGFISEENEARYAAKYRPLLHDIYMVKSGATTGVTAIVEDRTDFNIWSPLAAIRCDQSVAMPYFVLHFLRSKNFQEGVALNWSFGTQQNIGMGVLGDLPVLIPPVAEQKCTINFLSEQSKLVDALQDAAESSIPLLRERRSALISAAVTGKIDVRHVA